ncbi:hypothetical protein CHGG_04263 [Chaetomium globosum CBS 148.51]|uniref:Uncharacterized protein n=1 Tax=Chaetomium globosum (strain ATCC 6205 / CBS 148.51 / DSM 1962 / NBRC 6347 / NRRL 1970) TaxID=306901 RepID=Q2H1T3_CHAGB|nr:uncharacterized protein CHGG_04263 [Chaetomium globosum CBS 148.51]EAQ87644.1 hypothetical protein CHGG_04263 [Chaetomium globosum CBS 148.51]
MTPVEEAGARREPGTMHAFINSSAAWLNVHIKSFIRQHAPDAVFIDDFDEFPVGVDTVFQYCDGWALTQNFAAINVAKTGLINAYPNSDALARKDFLAAVVEYWATKRPDSILRKHVPLTVRLTLDYAEYVDDALMAADDLSLLHSLEQNEAKEAQHREWWILKPALVDCGAGIRLFSTIESSQVTWNLPRTRRTTTKRKARRAKQAKQHPRPPSRARRRTARKTVPSSPPRSPPPAWRPQYVFKAGGRIPSAQMRAFVAQRYIVAIPPLDGRKWHVRSYALSLGRLKVHVAREMLALLAGEDYQPPWENPSLKASLTNTALQDEDEFVERESMRDLASMEACSDRPMETHVFIRLCITAELFVRRHIRWPISSRRWISA